MQGNTGMGEHGNTTAIIIGAGPAGLTAAYELGKAGAAAIVLEQDAVVGGLAKTVNHKGFRFDIGGHRFYTKVKAVDEIWHEVLTEKDFKRRKRLSRIYYKKKFFHYPLRLSSVLFKLGIVDSCLILASYFYARLFPLRAELTFEQWVTNRFGRRLYKIFFKSYTEKVWGIPCGEITADWAAQRIKGLSLGQVLKDTLIRQTHRGEQSVVKTLINEFEYPRLGPGMMWEKMADLVRESGGTIRSGSRVEKIRWSKEKIEAVELVNEGRNESLSGTHFVSSMPIRELVHKLAPPPPPHVLAAADKLQYRDFLTVVLIINKRDLFPDNWIYIHDPEVKMGRVQNFKNWSSDMVPDPNKTCLGLEYFCFEGDGLWTMSDADLVELGKLELQKLGLAQPGDVAEGTVVRVPKAYPVYDSTYKQSLHTVRCFLEIFSNLQLVGRNGMHKYNNQDHSMLTAMLAAQNILGANHNLWEVNTDADYQEEIKSPAPMVEIAASQPRVPRRIGECSPTPAIEFEA